MGAKTVPTTEELLASVDAVVIAAASSAHADLIHACADAGRPTFCEKPITLDLASTAEVVEHVRGAGSRSRWGSSAGSIPGSGRLETCSPTVRSARSTWYGWPGTTRLRRTRSTSLPRAGLFRDFSVHDFDALRFVTKQETVEVYADGAVLAFPQFARYDDVDTGVATLRLSGGSFGILSVTRHDPLGYDIRMELLGSGDSIAVGWDERMPLRSVEPGAPPAPADAYRGFQERFAEAYRAEMNAFVQVAAGRQESACTAEDALEAMRVAVACDLSRKEHRPVRLEEVA